MSGIYHNNPRYLMADYDQALCLIMRDGVKKANRTGIDTIALDSIQMRFRLDHPDGLFPLITRRSIPWRSGIAELLWMLSGSTLNKDLKALGCNFWSPWCSSSNSRYMALADKYGYSIEDGDFGPVYGWQMRHFGANYLNYRPLTTSLANRLTSDRREYEIKECLSQGVDQLMNIVHILRTDPFGSQGRRTMWNLWNPKDLHLMALPPCHYSYQAYVNGDNSLTGIVSQRSCDFPVGVPFNILFYAAFTKMLAQQASLKPRALVMNMTDCHIYENQIDGVKEYLTRPMINSPRLKIYRRYALDQTIEDYRPNDFTVEDYSPQPKIKFPVAV